MTTTSDSKLSTASPLVYRLVWVICGLIFLAMEISLLWVTLFPLGVLTAPSPPEPPSADIPGVVSWGIIASIGYFLLCTIGLLKVRGVPVVNSFIYVFSLGLCVPSYGVLIPFVFSSFGLDEPGMGDLIGRLVMGYGVPALAIMAFVSLRARMATTWLGKLVKRKWWVAGTICMVLPLTVITLIATLLLIDS